MKIKEIIKSIEHIPKCPKSGESNLYYMIKDYSDLVNQLKKEKGL